MMKRLLLVALTLSALGIMQAAPASAGEPDTKAVVTLRQAVTDSRPPAPGLVRATVGDEGDGQAIPDALPATSSTLTLIVLIGCVGICLGSLLTHFRKPVPVTDRS
jgi:hypothetical protein